MKFECKVKEDRVSNLIYVEKEIQSRWYLKRGRYGGENFVKLLPGVIFRRSEGDDKIM